MSATVVSRYYIMVMYLDVCRYSCIIQTESNFINNENLCRSVSLLKFITSIIRVINTGEGGGKGKEEEEEGKM